MIWIAADTSTMIAFLKKHEGEDVDILRNAIIENCLFLPLPVIAELLSDPNLQINTYNAIERLPTLPIIDGYWHRAGKLRALVLSKGKKARLADALIAQNCIDNNVALITRDNDFRHYNLYGNLKLLPD